MTVEAVVDTEEVSTRLRCLSEPPSGLREQLLADLDRRDARTDAAASHLRESLGIMTRGAHDLALVVGMEEGSLPSQDQLERFARRFVERSRDVVWRSDDAVSHEGYPSLTQLVLEFPLPTFGSPPNGVEKLAHLVGQGGTVAVTGLMAESGHPVVAVISGLGTFIIWFAQPSVKVLRRSLAERVAAAVGTSVRPDDEA